MKDSKNATVKPCAIFVANRGFALTSSRLSLIRYFLKSGWLVVVATADDDYSRLLEDEGVVLEPVVLNRGGLGLGSDLRAFSSLWSIYRRYRPKLIHHFHAKPVILGTLAAHFAGRGRTVVVNTITGLGHAFIAGGIIRWLASLGYRLALPRSAVTIFQNQDDQRLFLEQHWLPKERARLVVSSGVDSKRFNVDPKGPDMKSPRVLMVGRILWQKGVGEFIEAARVLKQRYPTVKFQLAGEFDHVHPDSIPEETLSRAVSEGCVEFLGYANNLDNILPHIYLFVLPSYREGVPRVVLEAAACGVPAVGADVPGTREAIVEGKTGYLVPARDSVTLADRIERFLRDKELRGKMGKAAREMVESQFDINVITRQQLDIYRDVGIEIN